MKVAASAAVCVLIVMPVEAAQSQRQNGSPVSICDNDGHCTAFSAAALVASNRTSRRKTHTATAVVAPAATTAAPKIQDTTTAAMASAKMALDATGNAAGVVISATTGARARVGVAYAARFQAYIDDLENNHGARILFMGGIRPGRCSASSQHPCGKALDVCQLRRGVVDSRCNLPGRAALGQLAAAHGLFEGGRWCQSDYGHAQIGVTAAACGDSHIRIVRRTAPEPVADESHP